MGNNFVLLLPGIVSVLKKSLPSNIITGALFSSLYQMNAASASTTISGLPFEGPVGGLRLALIDGQWVAFPRWSEREKATFELVVAGRITPANDVAIAMIEAGAGKNAWDLIYNGNGVKPDEKVVAEGIEAAKPFIRTLCDAINELKKKAAKPTKEFQLFPEYTDEFYKRVEELAAADLDPALVIADKIERQERVREIKEKVAQTLASEFEDMSDEEKDRELGNAFKALQRSIVRRRVLEKGERIDGRGLKDIRTLSAEETKDLTQLESIWYEGEVSAGEHYNWTRYYALNLHSVFYRGTVEFRCFNSTLHAGRAAAYVNLCLAMSAQAINQRSAVMQKTHSDNELFTFRVWLVRLGLNGSEFKDTRDHLLGNLDGDRAWRYDKDSYDVNKKKKKNREMER